MFRFYGIGTTNGDSSAFSTCRARSIRLRTWRAARHAWKAIKGQKAKQPYAIAMKDGAPFGIAGIWENWRQPASGECIRTFAIITTDSNELVAEIHDGMPVILAPTDYARWLGEGLDPRDLMRPFPADLMRMWPISTRVNKPENDDPSVIEPIELVPKLASTFILNRNSWAKSNRGSLAAGRKESHPLSRRPRPPSSIFPFDVLLHAPPHLDQTAPDLLKKRNHLVDLRIAGQLELRIVGLCDGWTRRTGYG